MRVVVWMLYGTGGFFRDFSGIGKLANERRVFTFWIWLDLLLEKGDDGWFKEVYRFSSPL